MPPRISSKRKTYPPRLPDDIPGRAVTHHRQSHADALRHATRLIYAVCCLAGAADLLDEMRVEMNAEGIPDAIRRHDTGPLFDWLTAAFSYQGISDRVAADYMARHGRIRWRAI